MGRPKTKHMPIPPPGVALTAKYQDLFDRLMPALYGQRQGAPYELQQGLHRAYEWAIAYATGLAKDLGGGSIGPGPLQMIRAAAYAYAWSEEFFRQAGILGMEDTTSNRVTRMVELGARMADNARLQVVAAATLCAQQAALNGAPVVDALAPFIAELENEQATIKGRPPTPPGGSPDD